MKQLHEMTHEELWEFYKGAPDRLEDIPEELGPDDLTDEDIQKIIQKLSEDENA